MTQAGSVGDIKAVEFNIGSTAIRMETGMIAKQAHGAVLVRAGQTVVLVTVVMSRKADDDDFLPLTVEYREKLAAAGRIPGGFLRREGRIADHEVLASRILDRSVRPLFPKHFHHEVQVQATVLSADETSDEAPLLALLGASAALHVSAIPWQGPMAGMRLVQRDGKWHAFPQRQERKASSADFVIAGGRDGLIMLEGGASELTEDEVAKGLFWALDEIETICQHIDQLREIAGQPKHALAEPAADVVPDGWQTWLTSHEDRLVAALAVPGKRARKQASNELRRALVQGVSARA